MMRSSVAEAAKALYKLPGSSGGVRGKCLHPMGPVQMDQMQLTQEVFLTMHLCSLLSQRVALQLSMPCAN